MRILLVFGILLFSATQGASQSGLYMRTTYLGGPLNISWVYFTPDKRLVMNPLHGVNPINLQKEMAENKSNVASYTLSGNKMSLRWGDGRAHTVNVEFKNGVLTAFDGGLCTKASPFTFKTFQNKTYSGLATYGNVTRSITLFLAKDGSFKSERIGAVSGSGNLTGVAAATNEDSGTYVINGNTIIFRYANGKEWRAVAQPYDLGKEEIIINDQLFKRQ